MDLLDVKRVLGDTPYMSLDQARTMTEFMDEHGLRDILELGFLHGVSTCYMASALQNAGNGHITTVDLAKPENEGKEKIEEFLDALSLRDFVTVMYEPSSYTWRLMKMLEESAEPRFDLCYIDGAHNWAVDGFAFFLVDRLLRPGGWVIFDDLPWTYASSPALQEQQWVKDMPEEERVTPQLQRVFDLLVKRQPGYDTFRVEDNWGFARKGLEPDAGGAVRIVREVVVRREHYGLGAAATKAAKRAKAALAARKK